ncbi:Hsp20/alpha crystallin family protein [Opisthorchis viverrini]|uniref:Hsp20/alpha crystallin family protein n=1 Tax=Opisthorchis viverrini TaxID=6198 RepID=A0A1S8WX51_OPIVI|nr:Hsp20/alpha crystallin family protein [Opisthorchis viverrini]
MLVSRAWDIPVRWDGRTLEQCHRDMMSSLRNRFGRRASGDRSCLAQLVHAPDWNDEVNRWVEETQDRWNAEMKRLREEMFSLVPMDLFGVSPSDFFEPYGDVHSVLNRMDHQMRALTQHMEQEANQAASTEGGKSGPLAPRTSSSSLDFLKDAYQLGEDGRVRFDLQGYGPDDIKVSTSDNGVTVHAKKVVQTDRALSSREYSRTIYIPKSVDKNQLECHLTEDGVLMLEAPVKTADYKSITFDRDRQLSIKPHSETEVGQKRKSEDELAIQPTATTFRPDRLIDCVLYCCSAGVLGPTVLKDDKSGGEKLHVEIPVDPEFTADDLCVRMDANRVVVSGKKKTVDKTGNSSSIFIKEFSRSYDVPQTVDTFSVNAQLQGGKLLVEAPLLRPSTSQ